MSDLLLHNLRTIGTHHCDGKVGEEAADEIERLRETVKNLRESAKLAVHYHAKEFADVTAELAQAMQERSRAIAVGIDMEQEVERLRDQLHLAEVARAAQVAGLREALLQCGESCSIFDVRSIVRGALSAGKGAA